MGGGKSGHGSAECAGKGGQWCFAEVTSWDERGFGFVESADLPRKVYVHSSAFGGGDLIVGERVRVEVCPDQRDSTKLMAKQLMKQTQPVMQADAKTGNYTTAETAQGSDYTAAVVNEWNGDRGFGFLVTDDGRKAYIHHSTFGGGSLTQGCACEAILSPDRINSGKWMVAAIRGNDELIIPPDEARAKRQRLG